MQGVVAVYSHSTWTIGSTRIVYVNVEIYASGDDTPVFCRIRDMNAPNRHPGSQKMSALLV